MIFFKRTILLCTLALCSFNIYAQSKSDEPRYLIDVSKVKVKGFGNTHSELSLVNSRAAYFGGLSGAFLLNYKYYVGAYSYSISSVSQWDDIYSQGYHPVSNPSAPLYTNSRLCFNHGGIMLGYVHNYSNLWHPSIELKLGTGKVSLVDMDFNITDFDNHHSDRVGVVSPELGLEVNLTRWFKIKFGAGYRFVFGVDNAEYVNKDGLNKRLFSSNQFSSPYAAIGFYFGSFGPRTNEKQ